MKKNSLLPLFALTLLLSPLANSSPILSATATTSGGTLIDFEGQSSGINADGLYSGLGVTFSTNSGNSRIWDPVSAGNQQANSGTGVLGATSLGWSPLTMTFDSAMEFVEFFFADPNTLSSSTVYTFSAYDAGNALLESHNVSATSSFLPGFFTGFTRGSADITSVSIAANVTGENFNIDDLRFGTADIPEPSALVLIALGLLGVGLSRKQGLNPR